MQSILLVFLGGGCGSVCRWGISLWLKRYAVSLGGLPIHTLAANLLGCMLIGMFTAWLAKQPNPQWALLLTTGFCGGFTTFSTFSLELLDLLRTGHSGLAVLYLAVSLLVCVGAVAGGMMLLKN